MTELLSILFKSPIEQFKRMLASMPLHKLNGNKNEKFYAKDKLIEDIDYYLNNIETDIAQLFIPQYRDDGSLFIDSFVTNKDDLHAYKELVEKIEYDY